MLRHALQVLFAITLILRLIPGMGELVEQVVDLATRGHFDYSIVGEHSADHVEGDCTPLQHTCPCHHNTASTMVAHSGEQPRFEDWLTWMMRADERPRRGAPDRARPPELMAPTNRAIAPPTPPPNPAV